jgi:hypothetical protein
MSKPSSRPPILCTQRLDGLCSAAGQQILDAAAGKMPERLVFSTAAAAVRLAQRQAVPAEMMPERVLELVRATLKSLAQQSWKLDTVLLLNKHHREGGHEIGQ